MTDAAVDVRKLHKRYRSRPGWSNLRRGRLRGEPFEVLRDITFRAEPAECVALLGANGAGKSTLLKCLAGLVTPDAGSASVVGHDVALAGAELRRDATYVAGSDRSFSWRLSGRANLAFFAALYGYRGADARDRTEDVLDRVGLDGRARRRVVAEYSTGMRQRLTLARGFLANPRVWLLDEPTVGLDPKGARDVLDDIRGHVGRAVVIMATHSLEHANAIASRAIVLRAGSLIHDGDLDTAAKLVSE